MRIMVFDVPAVTGGAVSVLKDFHHSFSKDMDNEYIFVVSTPDLLETDNIRVLRYPWIKKSWVHRLFFDFFIAPRLVKEFHVEKVLSLQNVTIPRTSVYQTLYLHNALPFVEHRFSIFENRLLWTYQNVISKFIFASIRRADEVIVQTYWMKRECINRLGEREDKVKVVPPRIGLEVKRPFELTNESWSTFFYPASGQEFKNHRAIVLACLLLKERGFSDFKVIFTLSGNESKDIMELYCTVKGRDLPIEFIGQISRTEVFRYYSKSVLVFPSYVESSPLPLSEARMHGTPVLASDYAFSREVLDGYKQAKFFNPHDIEQIAEVMAKHLLERKK